MADGPPSSASESAGAVAGAGINKSHGASLCLVGADGQPLFCASEERFTRIKLQRGMPRQTYAYAEARYDLERAPLAIGRLSTPRRIAREAEYYGQSRRAGLFTPRPTQRLAEVAALAYRKKIRRDRELHRLSIDTRDFAGRSIDHGFDHHLCHLASAYYCSGFETAVLLSVDGVGDLLSAVVGRGSGGNVEVTKRYFQSEQISGQSYEIVTAMLGFHPDKHPGKVTGLAAYETPNPELVGELDAWFSAQYRHGAIDNWFHLIHTDEEEEQLRRLRQLRHERFGRWTREEIASAIQFMLERDVLSLVRRHVPQPEGKDIALAGGVFANVKLNQRIKELGFRSVFIQPGMGDEGTGLGAALLAAHEVTPFLPYPLHDAYLGPGFTAGEIRAALERSDLPFAEFPTGQLESELADHLTRGHIVARFQGRMEFGPRALGNRSILYEARDPTVNDWLNEQLKRSEFMPFAPITLIEHASGCYFGVSGAEHTAEFMTMTFDVTPTMAAQSPACVHVDGTARPQLVRPEVNPSLYETLRLYHDRTGIPSLINTSFNMHEEPIVCTPDEGIRAFVAANLDVLAIGDFIVVNPSEDALHRRRSAAGAT